MYVELNIRAGALIRYKTRGAAERIIPDKARIASILNGLKHDPFYTHHDSLFAYDEKIEQKVCDNPHVFYQISNHCYGCEFLCVLLINY